MCFRPCVVQAKEENLGGPDPAKPNHGTDLILRRLGLPSAERTDAASHDCQLTLRPAANGVRSDLVIEGPTHTVDPDSRRVKK
jgi:hypothetical protein